MADADVLLVSLATTPGLRRADERLQADLEREGLSVAVARGRYDALDRWPQQPFLDLYQGLSGHVAVRRALRLWQPRSIIHASPVTALFEPAERLRRSVIRFDAPLLLNRPGVRNAGQRALERRVLRLARAVAPGSPRPTERLLASAPRDAEVIPVGFPIDPPAGIAADREPLVLCYAGSPRKKGLDILARAWAQADRGGRRLAVAGLPREDALTFLAEHGIQEPPDTEWLGWLAPEEFGSLLGRAEVFVAASRRDEYGTAQLQALAAGCLLVHADVPGFCEPLERARELDPALVAPAQDPDGLARCLERAFARDATARDAYVARARELLADYSAPAFAAILRERLVPALRG
jgi:glycosyltransferase involved in cell wall biosynthesis